MSKKTLSFVIGLLCIALNVNSCSSNYWDGEWATKNEKIKVVLNSSTMQADVTIMLGDTPINYTTEWEYIDKNSIVYADYASNQYTVIKKGGEGFTYRPLTGEMFPMGVTFKKK